MPLPQASARGSDFHPRPLFSTTKILCQCRSVRHWRAGCTSAWHALA
jgi:hypothetical protein